MLWQGEGKPCSAWSARSLHAPPCVQKRQECSASGKLILPNRTKNPIKERMREMQSLDGELAPPGLTSLAGFTHWWPWGWPSREALTRHHQTHGPLPAPWPACPCHPGPQPPARVHWCSLVTWRARLPGSTEGTSPVSARAI
jgi:hypothetical protein